MKSCNGTNRYYLVEFFTQSGRSPVYGHAGPLIASEAQLASGQWIQEESSWLGTAKICEELFKVSPDSYSYLVITELTDVAPELHLPS